MKTLLQLNKNAISSSKSYNFKLSLERSSRGLTHLVLPLNVLLWSEHLLPLLPQGGLQLAGQQGRGGTEELLTELRRLLDEVDWLGLDYFQLL